MPLNVKWDITYKCNLNCGHCLNGSLLGNDICELDTDGVKSVIDKLCESEVNYIHLLGGEPTTREDFLEITEYIGEKGIFFGFNTNGLNILKPGKFEVLENLHLKNIVFSIEGPTAEINDRIRGKNVFNVITKNLKKIIQYRDMNDLKTLELTINTVLSRENYQSMMDMINFCIDLGVDELNILQLVLEGNAQDSNMLLTNKEELEIVELLAKKYQEVKGKLKINPKFTTPIVQDYCREVLSLDFPLYEHFCGAGSSFAFVDNRGNIYPCDRFKYRCGGERPEYSLLTRSFYEVWGELQFNDIYCMSEGDLYYKSYTPCNRCRHLQKSCYPCVLCSNNGDNKVVHGCEKYFEALGW